LSNVTSVQRLLAFLDEEERDGETRCQVMCTCRMHVGADARQKQPPPSNACNSGPHSLSIPHLSSWLNAALQRFKCAGALLLRDVPWRSVHRTWSRGVHPRNSSVGRTAIQRWTYSLLAFWSSFVTVPRL